jgi:hypothetical protein
VADAFEVMAKVNELLEGWDRCAILNANLQNLLWLSQKMAFLTEKAIFCM